MIAYDASVKNKKRSKKMRRPPESNQAPLSERAKRANHYTRAANSLHLGALVLFSVSCSSHLALAAPLAILSRAARETNIVSTCLAFNAKQWATNGKRHS